MSYHKHTAVILQVVVLLITFLAGNRASHSATLVNSPRAIALGGCSVNLVDEQAALHNPGAVGLFHLRNWLGVSIPIGTRWFSDFPPDVKLKTFSISGGGSARALDISWDDKFNFGVGVAYSRHTFDWGEIQWRDAEGNPTGTSEIVDRNRRYTIGIGVEYYVRVGVGYTHRKTKSGLYPPIPGWNLNYEESSHDIGIIAEVPVLDILGHRANDSPPNEDALSYEFTPSFAYVETNRGSIHQVSRQKIGVAGYFAIRRQHRLLGSVRVVYEQEKKREGSIEDQEKYGAEVGILGVLFVRGGKYRIEFPANAQDASTFGFGVSLRGVASMLFRPEILSSDHAIINHILRTLDITFDYAKFDWKEGDSRHLYRLSLSL